LPRKKKQEISVNNVDSLSGLLQETYNDACANINDAQKNINELVNSVKAEDVDDATKIAKEKSNALKIKDSAIRIKLEIAKLQNDIIKHKGDAESAINERSGGNITLDDFSKVREMIKKGANNKNDSDED
jgi:acyl-CoA reductase-like NAD-dependent aldehyde dehydrogenase